MPDRVLPFPPAVPATRLTRLASLAAIGVAVMLLAASSFLAYGTLRGVQAGNRLGDRVRAEQFAADALLATLIDAETGERGFLLTGDTAYLEPYANARARVAADIARLHASPVVDATQTARILNTLAITGARLDALGAAVLLRRGGNLRAALDLMRAGDGKRLMDALRGEVDAMRADGEATMARTHRDTESAWLWVAPIGLACLACVLLGGVALDQRRRWAMVAAALARREEFTAAFGLAQGMLRDMNGRITFWGAGMQLLYGYGQEAVGQLSNELLATHFPCKLAQIEASLLRHGRWRGELTHRHKDGHSLTVMSDWVLHRDAGGSPISVIETSNDITALKGAESQLLLALDSAALGTWQWDVGGTGAMVWDARCRRLYGVAPEADASYEAWRRVVAPQDLPAAAAAVAAALDPTNANDDYTAGFATDYRVIHGDGTVLWLAATGRALFVPNQAVAAGRCVSSMLGTVRDVSAVRQAEHEREQASALLRTIIETVPGPIYAKDREGHMLVANAATLRQIGKPWDEVHGHTDAEFLDNAVQAGAVMANDRRIMELGDADAMEEIGHTAGGESRAWLVTRAPMRDTVGAVIGLVGVSIEITERKRAEDRHLLLIHELNHRVKNSLVTVQAIAAETLRGADPELREAFDARLVGLAAAHDALLDDGWNSASLHHVVAGALAPFGGATGDRFTVTGPPICLQSHAALALAMGMHELATNATKYGALSVPGGRIAVGWQIDGEEGTGFRLVWTETGGPAVTLPVRRGFGTRLIERGLARDLRGSATIAFDPRGVTCVIEAPLADLAARSDVVALPRVGGMQRN